MHIKKSGVSEDGGNARQENTRQLLDTPGASAYYPILLLHHVNHKRGGAVPRLCSYSSHNINSARLPGTPGK
jgi:hypothetical protein